jgi:ABC-type Na+ efflux pump permease subunit
MRFVWLSAFKDLSRLRRDPLRLAAWIGIPLMLAVIMNLVFGGREAAPQGLLLVADEDESALSNALTGAVGRRPLARMLLVEKVKREEGRARIDRGDGSAFLIIPPGLQDAYLRNQPFRLQLFTNPSQRILPQIVQESLSIMLEGGFYLQQVAGDLLPVLDTGQAPSDQTVAQWGVIINHRVTALRKYLDPPLIELETSVVQEKRQGVAELFFPGMIFMAVLFLANGLCQDIWNERALGTLRRLAVTPAPFSAFLGGRLIFVGLVLFTVALAGLAALRWLAGVPVSNLPAALLWVMFAGVALHLVLLLVAMHASSQRAAVVLGNLVVFPLMLAGGCFFPFEMMPGWMARIARLTPTGWAVVQFKAVLSGSANARGLAAALAGLALVSALAFWLVLRRTRRSFLV